MSEQQMKVTDLRSALALLSQYDDELIYTDEPVDPIAELSGVYRYVGAHGTVQRPTRVGPAMIFNKVKGYDDVRVLIGLLCSRQRVARLFGTTPEKPGVYAQRLRGESYRANHHPARPGGLP